VGFGNRREILKIKGSDLRLLRGEEIVEGWMVCKDEIVDTWRWGDVYEIVLLHSSSTFWLFRYRTERTNDEFRVLIPEGDEEVELYEVEPHTTVVTVYKRKGE
jgi:hypothetical protein